MSQNWNKASRQTVNNETTAQNSKSCPSTDSSRKDRDTLTPTKDKSPDDLDI
ncbi:hypothetical protein [Desulfosporosinus acidiphilus]|uniref:hypothetical protein n=1 Tax=Desulfosporosinus acidiphilus TaxID=885581 RepID=UPI0002E4877A|nr:hypothetical protein [Desulfosporosinus acidiphilus]